MDDMLNIQAGFTILSIWDDNNGDVSATYRAIYAGPDLDEVEIPGVDCERLAKLGWTIDDDVRRWCYQT